MKYIEETLEIIDIVREKLNIQYDPNDKYASIIYNLNEVEQVDLGYTRVKIEKFLLYLEIEHMRYNIAKYLIPNVNILDIPREFVDSRELSDLSDLQILKYFVMVLKTISWVQKENLLVLKYSRNIWNTGWHNLAKLCRGLVIDLSTEVVVSYPFNKFYNLNEVEDTRLDRVYYLFENAKEINITDKKDGSAINVTNYKGTIIINTNGEFDNIQTRLAKELLETQYSKFYNNIPEGYTFVFELVHPNNRIILDYGETKKLYLLGMRDLSTSQLCKYNEMKDFSDKWGLDITESYSNQDLDEMIALTQNKKVELKEGWVIRVITDVEDLIFKLKYEEYFKLSRIKSIPSLKKLYILLEQGQLDDMLSITEECIREELESKILLIYDYIEKVRYLVEKEGKILLQKYKVERLNIPKKDWLSILSDLKGHPLSTPITRYLNTENDIFKILPTNKVFEKYYYYVNSIYGIEEDLWDRRGFMEYTR